VIITMLAGDVQARVNRTLKALGELERTMLPLVEAAVQTTARPWWDLFGKTFSKGRDTEILLASVGSLEGLATLRARLESMRDLCAEAGTDAQVQVSHEDMFHITAAQRLVSNVTAVAELLGGDGGE